ncbi:hypothetical protein B0J14DRAFT_588204 [Halenospora varia]|nr:hypothetical protein B0J14DRAFT_588204 [Halenospora varia]
MPPKNAPTPVSNPAPDPASAPAVRFYSNLSLALLIFYQTGPPARTLPNGNQLSAETIRLLNMAEVPPWSTNGIGRILLPLPNLRDLDFKTTLHTLPWNGFNSYVYASWGHIKGSIPREPCTKCVTRGRFQTCVKLPASYLFFKGCCTNCAWMNNSRGCSFRTDPYGKSIGSQHTLRDSVLTVGIENGDDEEGDDDGEDDDGEDDSPALDSRPSKGGRILRGIKGNDRTAGTTAGTKQGVRSSGRHGSKVAAAREDYEEELA